MKPLIIITIISVLLASCEKEIKLDEKYLEPKLVLNSLFEAGDTLEVQLSESRNVLFQNNYMELPFVSGANIKLMDSDDNILGVFEGGENGIYLLTTYFPSAGETYKIEASKSGFNTIYSTNYIPKAKSINSINVVENSNGYKVTVEIEDDGDEKNYYGLVVESLTIYPYEIEPGVIFYDTFINSWACSNDIAIDGNADIDGQICVPEFYFTDDLFNGTNYSIIIDKNNWEGSAFQLNVKLINLSPEMYKYKTSLQKYEYNDGTPFSEPVQVYSNIENGFGIFAGKSVYVDTVQL